MIIKDGPWLTSVNDNPLLMIVNDDTLLTNVNNNPLLTIVKEEKRKEETDLKGIGTYDLVILKKISRSFSSSTTFSCMKDNYSFFNDR